MTEGPKRHILHKDFDGILKRRVQFSLFNLFLLVSVLMITAFFAGTKIGGVFNLSPFAMFRAGTSDFKMLSGVKCTDNANAQCFGISCSDLGRSPVDGSCGGDKPYCCSKRTVEQPDCSADVGGQCFSEDCGVLSRDIVDGYCADDRKQFCCSTTVKIPECSGCYNKNDCGVKPDCESACNYCQKEADSDNPLCKGCVYTSDCGNKNDCNILCNFCKQNQNTLCKGCQNKSDCGKKDDCNELCNFCKEDQTGGVDSKTPTRIPAPGTGSNKRSTPTPDPRGSSQCQGCYSLNGECDSEAPRCVLNRCCDRTINNVPTAKPTVKPATKVPAPDTAKPTVPHTVKTVNCTKGASCDEIYQEACSTSSGESGTKWCNKKGTCIGDGGGTMCSWGGGSYCEDCVSNGSGGGGGSTTKELRDDCESCSSGGQCASGTCNGGKCGWAKNC